MFRESSTSIRKYLPAAVVALLAFVPATPILGQATWTTTGTNTYCITCNVGIATSTPTQRLQLAAGNIHVPHGNSQLDGNIYLGGLTTSGERGMRLFGGYVNGSISAGFIDVVTTDPGDGLRIRVDTAFGGAERMRIGADGMVTVWGNFQVGGNIAAKYQDLAEWVPATRRLPAGTVVIIDESAVNHVATSKRSYDTKVAGVVSAKPGLILGEAGPDKALVATTGRVKVRVDASRGAVRIGDLLVTSDREGVAMRSQPIEVAGVQIHRPGTVIGKALESLAEGEGEILVLLSLQ